jgi:signal transduction histidine kinase/phage shock protein PspC (stress-responsive transcriptional regulator)
MLGGVAGGIAERFRIDPTIVRVGCVLVGLVSGIGVAVYVFAWLVFPVVGSNEGIVARAVRDRRGVVYAVACIPALVVVLLFASAIGAGWLGSLSWPLFLSFGGLILVWRNAGEAERRFLEQLIRPMLEFPARSGRAGWALVLRIVIGLALVGGGLSALVVGHPDRAALRPLAGVVLVIGGIVVLFGQWWLRLAQQLAAERQARVRAEERADVAAHVHDSVLQTLALIQRRADQPQQVVALARAQERELRSWLFGGPPRANEGEKPENLSDALSRIQREIEELHGIAVEVVTVGDCVLEADLDVLVSATREATLNAAKWSGAPLVTIFAECEAKSASVFVRDRGRGFELTQVPADRAGIAESIRGRMQRGGGATTIRSTPGEGTEVSLTMPRRGTRRQRAVGES